MESGDDCIRINTKDKCEAAALALGYADTTAIENNNPKKPPYCYYNPDNNVGRRLRFNTAISSTASCSSVDNCLCKGKTAY